MTPKPSLRDIASAAGISHVAVSLALKNDKSVSLETRERIQALANKMGYAPNPVYSQMMREARAGKTRYRATLGYLNISPKKYWKQNPLNRLIFEQSKSSCERLGYKLDHFWIEDWHSSWSGFLRMLKTRNIEGLLLAGSAYYELIQPLDFSEISVVNLTRELENPPFTLVKSDLHKAFILLSESLSALGYRKAFFPYSSFNQAHLYDFESALLIGQKYHDLKNGILAERVDATYSIQALRKIIAREKPDVVICNSERTLEFMKSLNAKRKRKIPSCLFDVMPNLKTHKGCWGIDHNYREVAQQGVETLIKQITHHQRGVPTHQVVISVSPEWVAPYSIA